MAPFRIVDGGVDQHLGNGRAVPGPLDLEHARHKSPGYPAGRSCSRTPAGSRGPGPGAGSPRAWHWSRPGPPPGARLDVHVPGRWPAPGRPGARDSGPACGAWPCRPPDWERPEVGSGRRYRSRSGRPRSPSRPDRLRPSGLASVGFRTYQSASGSAEWTRTDGAVPFRVRFRRRSGRAKVGTTVASTAEEPFHFRRTSRGSVRMLISMISLMNHSRRRARSAHSSSVWASGGAPG